MAERRVEIKITGEKEFVLERNAVASIDPEVCVNCGKCRRICPTESIAEFQRPICRICPDCAKGPMMFRGESEKFAHEHACSTGCPLGTIPEGYVNLIAEGKYDLAYDLIAELNPLPSVCARICHHPCETDCKRGLLIDKPLDIRGLKRFITDRVKPKREKFTARYNTRIAVVGAGPAGIMAAFDLSKKGYKVTVFEAGPKAGGMMRMGIPDFRLDKDILQEEIAALEEAGIEIRYNTIVGVNPTIDDLLADGFASVLITVGAQKGSRLPIEGADADQVYDAVTFMSRVNSDMPVAIGKKAIIIGAGSVAVDTARTLLRLGAETATCVCLESEEDIPAPESEVEEAKEEGVEFITSASPVKIDAEWVTVAGVLVKKVEKIERAENGRLTPVLVEGSDFEVEGDTVVFAVGQKPDIQNIAGRSGLKLDEAGRLVYDKETFMTSKDKVFVAGDVVAVRGSVIDALASGRKAALAIDNMLTGRKLQDRVEHVISTSDVTDIIYPVRLEDIAPQRMPKARFRDGFEEVEMGFSEKQAVNEAKRCMKCGYEKVAQETCIGCGACVSVCPENAISLVKPAEKE